MSDLTLASAMGHGARALRIAGEATLSQVADAARFSGLPWSSGKVGDFESGRVSPSLATYIAVASALSDVLERPVALSDLLTGVDGRVTISSRLSMEADKLRGVLSGDPIELNIFDLAGEFQRLVSSVEAVRDEHESWPEAIRRTKIGVRRTVSREFGDGDLRIARSLGINRDLAAAAMATAWGKTFIQQRDALAGPGSSAQKKGRVSRDLIAELKAVLDGSS